MTDNANYSHEIYCFAVYVHRVLTLLCWLFQQLQQLAAHIVHQMDEDRERGNRGESDMKIIDLDDNITDGINTDGIITDDIITDDINTADINTDNDNVDDNNIDDVDMVDVDMNNLERDDIEMDDTVMNDADPN